MTLAEIKALEATARRTDQEWQAALHDGVKGYQAKRADMAEQNETQAKLSAWPAVVKLLEEAGKLLAELDGCTNADPDECDNCMPRGDCGDAQIKALLARIDGDLSAKERK